MAWMTRSDEELKAFGYNIPIFRAVEHAGGAKNVAKELGYKSRETIHLWFRKGRMPSYQIAKLCELGGNKVTAAEILDSMIVGNLE